MRAGLFKRLGRATDAYREMSQAVRLTGASTPEAAMRKISGFVRLPGEGTSAR